jgi:hypothetical protein
LWLLRVDNKRKTIRQWAAYWWFLQPWFLLVAVIIAADFWCSSHTRLVATVVVGWLAVWIALASAWPAKDYLVRMTLAPEQRLTPNVQKLREPWHQPTRLLVPTQQSAV